MRSLGLDIGDKRTGVAISDPQGVLAIPLTVLDHKDEDAAIANILKLVEQYEAERVVVGLPYSLNGTLGQQANKVTAFIEKLRSVITTLNKVKGKQAHLSKVNIQLWDERLSTVAADRLMIEAGTKRKKGKQQRDAMAAALILQGFLDSLKH